MRLSVSLLASLGLVGSVAAQASNNFLFYSGVTTYATANGLGAADDGDCYLCYPSTFFNGIGQTVDANGAPVNRASGLQFTCQDQIAVTSNQFQYGVKGEDPATPGQIDLMNDLIRVNATLPPMPTGWTGTGIAWTYTTAFTTPVDTLADQQNVYPFMHHFPETAAGDRTYCWMSGWTQTNVGDNPNQLVVQNQAIFNFTGRIDTNNPATPVLSEFNDKLLRIHLRTTGAVMQVGADQLPAVQINATNPMYGAAACYPDQNTGRNDGVAFRILDANYPGASVAVLGNFGPTTTNPPIPLSSLVSASSVGNLYLNFPLIPVTFASGTLGAAGDFQFITFGAPLALPSPVGVMSFQGFILDFVGGRAVASNTAGFDAQ